MFDLHIMNNLVDFYQEFGNFADLFKFCNTIEISQCIIAQCSPNLQTDKKNTYTINGEMALKYTFSQTTLFPVYRIGKSSIYDLIVYLKQNINDLLQLYLSFADKQSQKTLLDLLCSQLFGREELLNDISDPLLLVSNNATSQSVKSIGELLYQVEAVQKDFPGKPLYLRFLQLADGSMKLKIFTEEPENLIFTTAEQAISDIALEMDKIIAMNETLGQALALSKQYMQEGQIADAIPIIATCDTVLQTMTQAIQQRYPSNMKQEQ